MGFIGKLTSKKIAVISLGYDEQFCKSVCSQLAESGAQVSHVSPNGRFPKWASEESRFSIAECNSSQFSSLLLMTDKRGTEILMDTFDFDSFVRGFVERQKPIAALGDGVMLLAVLGHLKDTHVSCDEESGQRLIKLGANVTDEILCVDNGILTASKAVDASNFISSISEEFSRIRRTEQRA